MLKTKARALNKLLMSFLILAFPLTVRAEDDTAYKCYKPDEVQKISQAIVDLQKCKVEVTQKDILIQQRINDFGGRPGPAFWQEPSFVVAGVSISFISGAFAAWYVLQHGK